VSLTKVLTQPEKWTSVSPWVLAAEVAPDDIYRDHFNCSPGGAASNSSAGKTPCRFMRVKVRRCRLTLSNPR